MDALRLALLKIALRTVIDGNLRFNIDTKLVGMGFCVGINVIAKRSCVGDRRRHKIFRFAACEAEHYALISRSDLAALLIDALVDVGTLLV